MNVDRVALNSYHEFWTFRKQEKGHVYINVYKIIHKIKPQHVFNLKNHVTTSGN